jgi:hypothetical protein
LFKCTITAIGLVLLSACREPQAPAADSGDASFVLDAPDGGICPAMCANLRAIGCAAGSDPKCLPACAQDIVILPRACWANAPTKAAAIACGDDTTGHLACE